MKLVRTRSSCLAAPAQSSQHAAPLRLRWECFTGRRPSGKTARCRQQQQCVVTAGVADVAGVLVLSAIPFLAVQALAESDLGTKLQEDLEAAKPQRRKEAQQKAAVAAQARADSPWYGPERPRWLGPIPYKYPQWLPGEAPGDYAFDVAALSAEEGKFDKYFELELLHARWAMLGMLGAVIPELLQYSGIADFVEPVWWRVGAAKAAGEDLNYLGVAGLRIAGGYGIIIIAVCQVLLMFGPEYARSCGIEALEPLGVYLPGDKNYPGGWAFDPLGLANDAVAAEDLKVKEIKHGRLAMVAWAGFFVQGAVTKTGPIQNLLDYSADPSNNIVSQLRNFNAGQITDPN